MLNNRYLIWCSAVLIFMTLIATSCSTKQTINKTKKSRVIRFEDAPPIDRYRLEVAYEVSKNWVKPEYSSPIGPKQMASIAFRIMPDGKIQNIFFTKRSGNIDLDKSALEAIRRTSPFKPHPKDVSKSYVEMGLRFGKEGVK